MTTWNDGYLHDISYTTGFYREISPVWLALATSLLGHRAPDITRPFRWAELGCAHGLSANVFAASNPKGEFWGFDFNPAHIESACRTAAGAGLANVTFRETAFADLADAPEASLPQFDFIVAHGIWTWVSDVARAQIVRIIRRFLAPGGLAYISHNTLTGWASMIPVQRFMRSWARAFPGPSTDVASAALGFARDLAKADAAFFPANPMVSGRIDGAATQDARYVAHEYLHANWAPTTFDDVADAMAEAKCGYIGSATLVENIDAVSLPPGVVKILAGISDPHLKEAIRELGGNRSFRRDLFRRGSDRPPLAEQRALLDAVVLCGLGRETETALQVATGVGELTLSLDVYGPVLERLASGPLSLREMRQMPVLSAQTLPEVLQAVAYLVSGSFAHPGPAETPDPAAIVLARGFNREVARQNGNGATLLVQAAPMLGSGVSADFVETLVAAEVAAGRHDEANLAGFVLDAVTRSARSVLKDGAVISDPLAAAAEIRARVQRILGERAPLFERLGIIPV